MGFIADSPKTWKQAVNDMPEPSVTTKEMMELLNERLSDDGDAFLKLVELRGGCTCHFLVMPPCHACSSPLTEDEAERLGWL